jgi:hypothetical protein
MKPMEGEQHTDMTTVDNNTDDNADDNTDETEASPQRVPRGVRWTTNSDLRLSGLSFPLALDGTPMRHAGQATVELRTDMWPFWLEEAIEAAVAASGYAAQMPPVVERLEASEHDAAAVETELDELLFRELRASMRAITASAFAIDAFYASVKARSPNHPQQAAWTNNRTARDVQVTETFRYHLGIGNATSITEIRSRVSQIFEYRDWAVHPGARFREPEYRPDLNVAVDWHFKAFRGENAVTATAWTVSLLDSLVALLDRGSDELAGTKEGARQKMNAILAVYDALEGFPPIGRAEPVEDDDEPASS